MGVGDREGGEREREKRNSGQSLGFWFMCLPEWINGSIVYRNGEGFVCVCVSSAVLRDFG